MGRRRETEEIFEVLRVKSGMINVVNSGCKSKSLV